MQTHQEKVQIIEIWLRDICPLGLLTRSGRLAPADANLIEEYVRRNHQGQELSFETLNEACTNLSVQDKLTWWDLTPENTVYRGAFAPAKPVKRELTDEELVERGLKTPRTPNVHSHLNDTPVKPLSESPVVIRAKKAEAQQKEAEFKRKAEEIAALYYSSGKLDHKATRGLRGVFVYFDAAKTQVNWEETYKYRRIAAEKYDKKKSQW